MKNFKLVELEVELEDGQKEIALTSINRPEMSSYISKTDTSSLVFMARNAIGEDGSCFEYIQIIHIRCKELEIRGEYVQKIFILFC